MSHLRATTPAEYARRKAVNDRIGEVFDKASTKKERDKRQEFVKDPYDTTSVPAWVLYERDQMFDAVTRERAMLGKGPIEMKKLVRVENCAKGHVDYGRKFCLYAMELVFDDWSGP